MVIQHDKRLMLFLCNNFERIFEKKCSNIKWLKYQVSQAAPTTSDLEKIKNLKFFFNLKYTLG